MKICFFQLKHFVAFWKWTCTGETIDWLTYVYIFLETMKHQLWFHYPRNPSSNATGADSGNSNSKKRIRGALSNKKQINDFKADECGFLHICLYHVLYYVEGLTHLFYTCSWISSGWQPTSWGLIDGFFFWHKTYLRVSTTHWICINRILCSWKPRWVY